jgi:hypothetical protein
MAEYDDELPACGASPQRTAALPRSRTGCIRRWLTARPACIRTSSTAPLAYRCMPGDFAHELERASLTTIKGDLNYRRPVDDRSALPCLSLEPTGWPRWSGSCHRRSAVLRRWTVCVRLDWGSRPAKLSRQELRQTTVRGGRVAHGRGLRSQDPQAARRWSSQIVAPSATAVRATNRPASMSWKCQNRSAGW